MVLGGAWTRTVKLCFSLSGCLLLKGAKNYVSQELGEETMSDCKKTSIFIEMAVCVCLTVACAVVVGCASDASSRVVLNEAGPESVESENSWQPTEVDRTDQGGSSAVLQSNTSKKAPGEEEGLSLKDILGPCDQFSSKAQSSGYAFQDGWWTKVVARNGDEEFCSRIIIWGTEVEFHDEYNAIYASPEDLKTMDYSNRGMVKVEVVGCDTLEEYLEAEDVNVEEGFDIFHDTGESVAGYALFSLNKYERYIAVKEVTQVWETEDGEIPHFTVTFYSDTAYKWSQVEIHKRGKDPMDFWIDLYYAEESDKRQYKENDPDGMVRVDFGVLPSILSGESSSPFVGEWMGAGEGEFGGCSLTVSGDGTWIEENENVSGTWEYAVAGNPLAGISLFDGEGYRLMFDIDGETMIAWADGSGRTILSKIE